MRREPAGQSLFSVAADGTPPTGRLTVDTPLQPLVTGREAGDQREAELLLADADDLRDDGRRLRTPDQRRADAFVALTQRVAEAVGG